MIVLLVLFFSRVTTKVSAQFLYFDATDFVVGNGIVIRFLVVGTCRRRARRGGRCDRPGSPICRGNRRPSG